MDFVYIHNEIKTIENLKDNQKKLIESMTTKSKDINVDFYEGFNID